MNQLILGIDFGTSSNFVTKYDFNKKDAVPVANMGPYGQGNIFDNCLYIEGEDKFIIGDQRRSSSDPLNFFYDIKRYIADDEWRHRVPNLGNREYNAQDIAEFMFTAIRKKVEQNENRKVDGAVIAVPYAYSEKYRSRLKMALEKAGISVIKMVEEPVAAAISFGIFNDLSADNKKEKVIVFDLGGGTFDITVFEYSKASNDKIKIEVLNTEGIEDLGGRKIDELIAEKFRERLGIEYSDIANAKELSSFKYQLKKTAKETKELLSTAYEEDIYHSFMMNNSPVELEFTLSRDEFYFWLKDNNIVSNIRAALERAIYDVDLEPEDIDRIVLAGGTSNTPLVKKMISEFFGKEPESKQNLGELVGHGAGILAGLSLGSSLDYEIIHRSNEYIGIAKGDKFQKIFAKKTVSGEMTPIMSFFLKNYSNGEIVVPFYEGVSDTIYDCKKTGKVIINGTEFNNGIVRLSLSIDEESLVKCFFYNDKYELVLSKYIEC